jgi:hypothetical protein
VPGPAYRLRLYEVTGLEQFTPSPADELAAAGPQEKEAYRRAVLALNRALTELEEALRAFTAGPPAARELLRRSLDSSRVARVTTLAQLMFDEEAYADWLLLDDALGGRES